MKTDDLIRALAADTKAQPSVSYRVALGLLPALFLALLALVLVLGLRPDLRTAIVDPVSDMRFVLGLGLGVAGLRGVLSQGSPLPSRGWLGFAGLVMLLAAGLWLWTWAGTPAEARPMAIAGKTLTACLVTIPLLSVLPVSALLTALRHGAPTAPARAGIAAGLAGGGFSAAIYALHCTEDNPLFFVTWYGSAILIVTCVATVVGSRLLRW